MNAPNSHRCQPDFDPEFKADPSAPEQKPARWVLDNGRFRSGKKPLSTYAEELAGTIFEHRFYWRRWAVDRWFLAPYKAEVSPMPDWKLAVKIKISGEKWNNSVSLNEPSARNYIGYLKELESRGLKVNEVTTGLTVEEQRVGKRLMNVVIFERVI